MGIDKTQHGVINNYFTHKNAYETYNCRVALWQLPYDKRYSQYDIDKTNWFEAINKNYNNEIENAQKGLKKSFSRFKVYTYTVQYNKESAVEESTYPNGNKVKVIKNKNFVYTKITDKSGDIVAEKCFNIESKDGRKTLYKHLKQDGNTFTIVRVFSYDTSKNKSSDVINYGYTSLDAALTDGCSLEKEYYLLNGEEVKPKKLDYFEYCVKDKNGKKIIFTEK